MQKFYLAFVGLFVLAVPCWGAGGFGECKPCRSALASVVEMAQAGIKGMEDKPNEMIFCNVGPCERVTLTNLQTLDLNPDVPPCSRPTTEGNTDCFEQNIPLCMKGWSMTCEHTSELTMVVQLLKAGGTEMVTKFCDTCGIGGKAMCEGAKAGAAVNGGLTKVQDAIKPVSFGIGVGTSKGKKKECTGDKCCIDDKMGFFLKFAGDFTMFDLCMTLNWTNDDNPTTVDKCQVSENSLGGMTCTGGGSSLLGVVVGLLTNTVPLGKVLGVMMQGMAKIIVPPIIKSNPTCKEYMGNMNCGD